MSETTMRFVIAATGDQAEKVLDGFGNKMNSVTKGFIKNGLEIAGAFAAIDAAKNFVKDSVEAAKAAELSQTQLKNAVTNSGNSMAAFNPRVEEADASMRKYGFTNAETHAALATLTIGLKDPAKALGVLSVAADLAKAKNMDLNSAALLVTKGMEGQTRPLKALGIDLPVYAGNAQAVALAQGHLVDAQQKVTDILAKTPNAMNPASKAHAAYEAAIDGVTKAQELLTNKQSSGQQILDAISSRLKGSASAAADTYAGKTAALSAQWDNLQEKAGKVLIPVLTGIVDWLNNTGVPAVQHFSDGWNGVAGAMGNAAEAGKNLHSFMHDWKTFWESVGYHIGDLSNAKGQAYMANHANDPSQLQFNAATSGQNSARYGTSSLLAIPRNAAGGTYAPQPGGHIVRLAEAGRSETIVDTASLNRAVKHGSGGVTAYFTINQVTDTVGTAMATVRRLKALAI